MQEALLEMLQEYDNTRKEKEQEKKRQRVEYSHHQIFMITAHYILIVQL